MLSKEKLSVLYISERKSMQEIADIFDCSLHKVKYWMSKHGIAIRARKDAMYVKYNPDGDPFKIKIPKNLSQAKLFGLGLGLYWGEGTKASKSSIRLGNTDPALIRMFIRFLVEMFEIEKDDMRFALQIFTDISVKRALKFWKKELGIKQSQFMKPIITRSGSLGTYRKKSEYGVMTVMYHNRKLRDILVEMLSI